MPPRARLSPSLSLPFAAALALSRLTPAVRGGLQPVPSARRYCSRAYAVIFSEHLDPLLRLEWELLFRLAPLLQRKGERGS